MTVRALSSIVLAGALLALPAFAAWGPARAGRNPGIVPVGLSSGVHEPTHPGTRLVAVEIIEAGSVPVSRMVEIQTVPEPSTLLLLLPAGLLALRRRR